MRKSILSFLVVAALVISFAACNNPEQPHIKFKIGDHLRIDGPSSLNALKKDTTTTDPNDYKSTLPVSGDYKVVYGTVDVDYKWSVAGGATIDSTYWYKDLRAHITFPSTGTYTIKISGTYKNGHTYNGKLKVDVTKRNN